MVDLNSTIEIDDKDKSILEVLQNNANASLRDISNQINLSTTAIRARIKNLKEKQIIKKAITLIDCHQLGYHEMVIASLRVNSSYPLEKTKEKIDKMMQIRFAYVITGEYPLFIMAKCLDHEDAVDLLEKLRNLPGVEEVKTQLVLDRIKEDPTIIIPK